MEVLTSTENHGIPLIFERLLLHQRQKSNWDCGVSCVLMVLPQKQREDFLMNFHEVCDEEGFNKSTWTIDLCYLLLRYGVKHVFCTLTLGINPGYHNQAFYARILQKDEDRVMERFSSAAEKGILVKVKSLTAEDLVKHLARHGPIILLTNASLLNCEFCKCKKLIAELRSWLSWNYTYNGHYIVLCGYNLPRQKFYFHNPTYKNRVCCTSFASLNEVRQSYGTDEDTILVYCDY